MAYKKDLYEVYKSQQASLNVPFVQYSKFVELWNAMYPYHQLRTWISPVGKCNLCGEIDAKRRAATESCVKEALRQCHSMHRGGFIYPERARLFYFIYMTNIYILI
jgi:hypothetical protein